MVVFLFWQSYTIVYQYSIIYKWSVCLSEILDKQTGPNPFHS